MRSAQPTISVVIEYKIDDHSNLFISSWTLFIEMHDSEALKLWRLQLAASGIAAVFFLIYFSLNAADVASTASYIRYYGRHSDPINVVLALSVLQMIFGLVLWLGLVAWIVISAKQMQHAWDGTESDHEHLAALIEKRMKLFFILTTAALFLNFVWFVSRFAYFSSLGGYLNSYANAVIAMFVLGTLAAIAAIVLASLVTKKASSAHGFVEEEGGVSHTNNEYKTSDPQQQQTTLPNMYNDSITPNNPPIGTANVQQSQPSATAFSQSPPQPVTNPAPAAGQPGQPGTWLQVQGTQPGAPPLFTFIPAGQPLPSSHLVPNNASQHQQG